MAGKFLNTQYFDTVDKIVEMNEDLIKNPLYLFNDKKGTRVTYYNINTEKTTLDPGSKLAYTDIGSNSPIRFNVIYGLFLYQFVKAELNLNNDEFGLESDAIQGESYILPNTIIPCDGDYFEVSHIKDSTWLFKVVDSQKDTLENGANVYKISWKLDRTSNRDILKNIVEEYKYIDVEEGTNLKAVVKLEKYEISEKLDLLSLNLSEYFSDLFYDEKVQTFIYKWYTEYNMYDPFAIEFIQRNKLLYRKDDKYIYVQQKIPLPKTFSIDYSKSIFRMFETCDLKRLASSQYSSQADIIDSPLTIFASRYEQYFALNYHVFYEDNSPLHPRQVIPILPEDLITHIIENRKYVTPENLYMNIFVKFFHKEDLNADDLDTIENINFNNGKEIYYTLLFLIYCVDYYTKKLLS